MTQYVEGCERCRIFKNDEEDREIIVRGTITVENLKIPWILIESRPKATTHHYVFTTPHHHLGPQSIKQRAELNKVATVVAGDLLGRNYRILNNSGNAAAEEHYHTHLYRRDEGERLPSGVKNIERIITVDLLKEFPDINPNISMWLAANILQQN